MRPLTFDEVNYVSGGSNDGGLPPNINPGVATFDGGSITVTGSRYSSGIDFGFGNLNIGLNGTFQFGGVAGPVFDDPNEIVVTATRDPVAAAIADFVQANLADLLAALGGNYGGIRGGLAGGAIGNAFAPSVGDATFDIANKFNQTPQTPAILCGYLLAQP